MLARLIPLPIRSLNKLFIYAIDNVHLSTQYYKNFRDVSQLHNLPPPSPQLPPALLANIHCNFHSLFWMVDLWNDLTSLLFEIVYLQQSLTS